MRAIASAAILLLATLTFAAEIDREALVRYTADAGERLWATVQKEDKGKLGSRDLFTYALALCEAQRHPERLETLFTTAAKMQDRDPASKSFGNFRWYWSAPAVEDYNAVEFSMQGGALLWLRHRDTMPADAKKVLAEVLDFAVEGCLRHRVREDYTNIALMNAANLILLGEALDRPKVAAEGQARLDRVMMYTFLNGTHEYVSPTYYGVNLDVLLTLERFCASGRAKTQAQALLNLLWIDIAANYHPACGKLTGTRSRDYDYLRGLGILDNHLALNGWIEDAKRGGMGLIWPLLGEWNIPEDVKKIRDIFPRTIRQSWGPADEQMRTNYLLPGITLSTSGAYYGGWMDLPLTLDFAGPREGVRGYFIPDGRQDPYGKVKIPAGGGHSKTHHLSCFFAAVQEKTHAAALAVYRQKDIPADCTSLLSHFILPFADNGFEVDGERLTFKPKEMRVVELEAGKTLILRRGAAALSIRIPFARGLDGGRAKATLIHDANDWGAVRLTINHGNPQDQPVKDGMAIASFIVQIAEGPFRLAMARVSAREDTIRMQVDTEDVKLVIATKAPFTSCSELTPLPPKSVLEVNGQDLGRRALAVAEPVRSLAAQRASMKPIPISADKPTHLEAEAGLIFPAMVAAADEMGTRFIWSPGDAGGRGGTSGSVSWPLVIPAAGNYYIWARVLAPTPEDDSFCLAIKQGNTHPLPRMDWPLGVRKEWTWVSLNGPDRKPLPIDLSAGPATLTLSAREDGAKVDALRITAAPDAKPD